VRGLARQLRPEVLDELGLPSALRDLAERFGAHAGLTVECTVQRRLPPIEREAELVLYRVAQESLTNAVRHAGAGSVTLNLEAGPDRVSLVISDDGSGLGTSREGAGIKGMRERAVLIGGELSISSLPQGGVEVRLDVLT